MEETTVLPPTQTETVPWNMRDVWIGVSMLGLLDIGYLLIAANWKNSPIFQGIGILIMELLYGLPVLVILFARKARWETLGLRRFQAKHVGLGCGMIIAAYAVIVIHNLALMMFGLNTQGNDIMRIFEDIQSPFWLVLAMVVAAPLVEETFFRGIVFTGMRQKWGWKIAAIVSSAVFAAFHLSLVAFIPTFVLGLALAVLYEQSKSLWPSILMHFLVNGFGVCAALVSTRMLPLLEQSLTR